MAKRPAKPVPKLYIGEWLRVLGMAQRTVADEAEIGESYLSLLINPGENPKNPSLANAHAIAEAMGITVNDLMRPPPSREVLREMSTLPPKLLERLRKA